jgi:malate dehydrogenase (oxaloacetate-decarboxylating)(NADP+)
MVLIAVVEAQAKQKSINTEELIKKSKWWKGFKKVSRDL